MEKSMEEIWVKRDKVFYQVVDASDERIAARYFTTKKEAFQAAKYLKYFIIRKIKNSNTLQNWNN